MSVSVEICYWKNCYRVACIKGCDIDIKAVKAKKETGCLKEEKMELLFLDFQIKTERNSLIKEKK